MRYTIPVMGKQRSRAAATGGSAATTYPWQAIPRAPPTTRPRRYSERHDEAHGSNSEDPPLPLAQITRSGISRFLSRDGDLLLSGGVTQCQSFHGAEVGKEALASQFYSFSGGRFAVVVTEPGDSARKQWRRLRCSGREDRSDTTSPLAVIRGRDWSARWRAQPRG